MMPTPGQGVVAVPPAPGEGGTDRAAAEARFWESAKRYCPWPPDPSSWQVLDGPCLSIMNRRNLDENWLLALDDPLAAWRAVSEALARLECNVPEGGMRPDLREACAADAMVQIARLQIKCAKRVRQDPEDLFELRQRRLHDWPNNGQEAYHRMVEDNRRGAAYTFWAVYTCRTVPREAHEWIAAIPEPEGDPASLTDWRVISIEDEDGGGVARLWLPTNRVSDLYEAARRLGATVPD